MAVKRSACGTTMLVCGICFTIITIVFVSVSFGTDYWLENTVHRSRLPSTIQNAYATNGRYTFTRHRGLFRECYPTNDTAAFLNSQTDVKDSNCFETDLKIPDSTPTDLSTEYTARIHLLRACIAFIAVGIFLNIVLFIIGLVPLSCSRRSKWAFTAGFLAFVVAFFVAGGIAFFHGAEYLEKRKITDIVGNYKFYQSWENDIKLNTDSKYEWSYALGWVGVACAIFTAIFFVIGGFYIGDERYEDREYLEKGRGRDYVSSGYENRAYPVEPSYPRDRPYPAPVAYPYPPPVAYGHPGPYIQDLETGRPLPTSAIPPYWSWS